MQNLHSIPFHVYFLSNKLFAIEKTTVALIIRNKPYFYFAIIRHNAYGAF